MIGGGIYNCVVGGCMGRVWDYESAPKEGQPDKVEVQDMIDAVPGGTSRVRQSKTSGYCEVVGRG